MRAKKQRVALLLLWVLIGMSWSQVSYAAQSSSPHYQVNEVFFGSGGSLNSCSTGNFCSKESIGETAVGNTSSTNYQAQAGFNTNRTPYLQFIVNTSSINLGVLHAGTTATATATFSVKSYLASGYVVKTVSPAPYNGNHYLSTPTTPTLSNAASEQFGMNLAANTTACSAPTNFGAAPVENPSSSFSFGAATSNYNSCGHFLYNNGDTIASSTKSSGETDYTISYIFNTTSTTPSGVYTMQQDLVATSTF